MITTKIQSLGGRAVIDRKPPARCPRCGASMRKKSYHGYLGHLGLHGKADRYYAGDISAAARKMANNALARAENGATWTNGAWSNKFKLAKTYQVEKAPMTTKFEDIDFNADYHKYYLGRQVLTSVTARLKELQKPFDRDGIAQRVAHREGRSVEDVLAEWDAKGQASIQLGNSVHHHIEQALKSTKKPAQQASFDQFLDLNPQLPEIQSFERLWSQLSQKVEIWPHHVEWVVGDKELGLGGTVDSLMQDKSTGKYHIWDWKTGKFDLHNKWESLLQPFDYLDASKLHIYSLQVSLYRLIIERNTGLEMGDSYLVHLNNDYQVYRAVDFREPLLRWLTNGRE